MIRKLLHTGKNMSTTRCKCYILRYFRLREREREREREKERGLLGSGFTFRIGRITVARAGLGPNLVTSLPVKFGSNNKQMHWLTLCYWEWALDSVPNLAVVKPSKKWKKYIIVYGVAFRRKFCNFVLTYWKQSALELTQISCIHIKNFFLKKSKFNHKWVS